MSSLQYTSKELADAATATYFAYDIFVYITFAFKPFVIAFFIYHFIKKTVNICNIFFYILFIGFVVDVFAWILVIADGFCWDYSANAAKDCWYIDVIFVPYSHYNNSFSSFWLLLLSINRLTAVISFSTYEKIWSPKICKFLIFLLFLSPFVIIGYSFINYKCRFYLACGDPNYWVTFSTVSAAGNGAISLLSFAIAVLTAVIYRTKKSSTMAENSDVKLIFQAGFTSFICIIHYISYAIAEGFRAYKAVNAEYKYDLNYVIINTFQFMAYPGYHFSAFFYLFVFSTNLRKQFLELYHLTWLYIIFNCCESTKTTRVVRIGSTPMGTTATTNSHSMTKSAFSTSLN